MRTVMPRLAGGAAAAGHAWRGRMPRMLPRNPREWKGEIVGRAQTECDSRAVRLRSFGFMCARHAVKSVKYCVKRTVQNCHMQIIALRAPRNDE